MIFCTRRHNFSETNSFFTTSYMFRLSTKAIVRLNYYRNIKERTCNKSHKYTFTLLLEILIMV
jgi:hypothetical protein